MFTGARPSSSTLVVAVKASARHGIFSPESCACRIDQIGHLDPSVPLRDVVQDLYVTDRTQEKCARPCRLCASQAGNMIYYIQYCRAVQIRTLLIAALPARPRPSMGIDDTDDLADLWKIENCRQSHPRDETVILEKCLVVAARRQSGANHESNAGIHTSLIGLFVGW